MCFWINGRIMACPPQKLRVQGERLYTAGVRDSADILVFYCKFRATPRELAPNPTARVAN